MLPSVLVHPALSTPVTVRVEASCALLTLTLLRPLTGEYVMPPFLSRDARDMIKRLLNTNPDKRYSLPQVTRTRPIRIKGKAVRRVGYTLHGAHHHRIR